MRKSPIVHLSTLMNTIAHQIDFVVRRFIVYVKGLIDYMID